MAKYFFHLVYDDRSELDGEGSECGHQFAAAQEAVLTPITLALEAQVHGKSVPRQIAVLDNSKERKLIALKNAD